MTRFVQEQQQIILHTQQGICASKLEILRSDVFRRIFLLYIIHLQRKNAPLLSAFPPQLTSVDSGTNLKEIFILLCRFAPAAGTAQIAPHLRRRAI